MPGTLFGIKVHDGWLKAKKHVLRVECHNWDMHVKFTTDNGILLRGDRLVIVMFLQKKYLQYVLWESQQYS